MLILPLLRPTHKTQQNTTKHNRTKQNKTKQHKTNQNKTKQNTTKQNTTNQSKQTPTNSISAHLIVLLRLAQDTINDHDVALAYVLDHYPSLLPSFEGLPQKQRESLRLAQLRAGGTKRQQETIKKPASSNKNNKNK